MDGQYQSLSPDRKLSLGHPVPLDSSQLLPSVLQSSPDAGEQSMPLSQAKPPMPTGTAPMFLFDPDASQSEDEDMDDEDDEDEGRNKKKRKGPAAAKGKKTAEDTARRKIEIGYIVKKEKRHITFSKRKAGIMKKAYELSTLTGTQVLLLVVSESGIVYTFTTTKFQPMVGVGPEGNPSEGQRLIQACLATSPTSGDAEASTSADQPVAPAPSVPVPTASTNRAFRSNTAHNGQVALRARTRANPSTPTDQLSDVHSTATDNSDHPSAPSMQDPNQQQLQHQQQLQNHQNHQMQHAPSPNREYYSNMQNVNNRGMSSVRTSVDYGDPRGADEYVTNGGRMEGYASADYGYPQHNGIRQPQHQQQHLMQQHQNPMHQPQHQPPQHQYSDAADRFPSPTSPHGNDPRQFAQLPNHMLRNQYMQPGQPIHNQYQQDPMGQADEYTRR